MIRGQPEPEEPPVAPYKPPPPVEKPVDFDTELDEYLEHRDNPLKPEEPPLC